MSGKLSWSHYCELLSISDEDKRNFYEKEAANAKWSVRELKRQISTSLYERLLLSKGEVNKEEVMKLAMCGIEINDPKDIIKDPYVFETDKIPSRRRNPIIADIFNRMKYMERRGSGFKKIKGDYRKEVNYKENLEPKIYSDNKSFWVTLFNLNYDVPIEKVAIGDEKVAIGDKKLAIEEIQMKCVNAGLRDRKSVV